MENPSNTPGAQNDSERFRAAVREASGSPEPFLAGSKHSAASNSINLENRFTYHPPKGDQQERYVALRNKGREFAELGAELTPHSPEQTLAIRKIEEAVMWFNASIARNE